MGVKSTRTLTRKEAEQLFELLHSVLYKRNIYLTNKDLENELERMNDKINGGEGFENFLINDD